MGLDIFLTIEPQYKVGIDYVRYGAGEYERHLLRGLRVENGYYGTREFTWGQLNAAYYYIKKRKEDCTHSEFEFIKNCLQFTKKQRNSLLITFQ